MDILDCSDAELLKELARRAGSRKMGRCDVCGGKQGISSPCKSSHRHDLKSLDIGNVRLMGHSGYADLTVSDLKAYIWHDCFSANEVAVVLAGSESEARQMLSENDGMATPKNPPCVMPVSEANILYATSSNI